MENSDFFFSFTKTKCLMCISFLLANSRAMPRPDIRDSPENLSVNIDGGPMNDQFVNATKEEEVKNDFQSARDLAHPTS